MLKSSCYCPDGGVEKFFIADVVGKETRKARLNWITPKPQPIAMEELALGMALLGEVPEEYQGLLDEEIALNQDSDRALLPTINPDANTAPVKFKSRDGAGWITVGAAKKLLNALKEEEYKEWQRARAQVERARKVAKECARQAKFMARLEREATAKLEGLNDLYVKATGEAIVKRNGGLAKMRAEAAQSVKIAAELARRIKETKEFLGRVQKSRRHYLEVLRRERAEGWGEYPPKWLEELCGGFEVVAA